MRAIMAIARAMIALCALMLSRPALPGDGQRLASTFPLPSAEVATGLAAAAVATAPTERTSSPGRIRTQGAGLSMPRGYARGKIPVILIHGLWSNPRSWNRMLAAFGDEPSLRERYQFWLFGYSTGDPILYSASLLRQAIQSARSQFDPERIDPAFGRMVLIGYSMGGLLAKTMAQDSQYRLWGTISTQPPDRLLGPPDAQKFLRESFLFRPLPEVERLMMIATPHRGSRLEHGFISLVASHFARPNDSLRHVYSTILGNNQPDFFQSSFRAGLPGSVDQLEWKHPLLINLDEIGIDPAVTYHSIIADLSNPPKPGGSDGVVPYESAHLDGSASEFLVHDTHLCQENPRVIEECRRILLDHASAPSRKLVPPHLSWQHESGASTETVKSLP
jgi:pimeloyl-ACP methyl ester carboxylesterase